MTAALTITRGNGQTARDEYDENDPAQVAEMRAKFEAAVTSVRGFAYKTPEGSGSSEQIRVGEFPKVGEKAETVVTPQYAGG